MVWKHVADSLPAWLRAEMEKGAEDFSPAQVVGRYNSETPQPAEAASLANGKSIATASPTRRPTSAVVIDLVLEAGRTDCPVYEQHAGAALSPSLTPCGASAHETAPARRQALTLLRVIEGGGRRREEGEASAAFRAHTGGGGRGRKLMLVVG